MNNRGRNAAVCCCAPIRRSGQEPGLKWLRWALLKDRGALTRETRADLDGVLAQLTTKRTARVWAYREQLR